MDLKTLSVDCFYCKLRCHLLFFSVFLCYLDGVNEVKAWMELTVRLVTDEMLLNSVTVRLAEMTEQAFLSPLYTYFVEALAAIIPCPKHNVYVFSVQVNNIAILSNIHLQ